MKTDAVFKRAFNDALDLVAMLGPAGVVPSETVLSRQLDVSRTTVRKVLAAMAARGVIAEEGSVRVVRAVEADGARFPVAETVMAGAHVEQRFMEWILRDNARPGTHMNELELARKFGVATTAIREFLNRFQRFGLIGRVPGGGWVLKGFTRDYAVELFHIRELFELRSAADFVALAESSPLWRRLEAMRAEHLELLGETESRYQDFPALDRRFHLLINSVAPNRFIDGFYEIITFVFHYHYQWNPNTERRRNEVALKEHLVYIDALMRRDGEAVEAACRAHLDSALKSLIEAASV